MEYMYDVRLKALELALQSFPELYGPISTDEILVRAEQFVVFLLTDSYEDDEEEPEQHEKLTGDDGFF